MYLLLFLDAAVLTLGRPAHTTLPDRRADGGRGSLVLTLGRPARTTLLSLLVPRAIFENAVAWRTSTQQITGLTGPALGGFIVAASLPVADVASGTSTLLFFHSSGGSRSRAARRR